MVTLPGASKVYSRPVTKDAGRLLCAGVGQKCAQEIVPPRIVGHVYRERMARCVIRLRFQIETPGIVVGTRAAPPIRQNFLCPCIAIQVAVVHIAPQLYDLPIHALRDLPGKAVSADG